MAVSLSVVSASQLLDMLPIDTLPLLRRSHQFSVALSVVRSVLHVSHTQVDRLISSHLKDVIWILTFCQPVSPLTHPRIHWTSCARAAAWPG
jgi:hypothetical protein